MNDELTSRLSRQLHEQVDDWQAAPLSLEGVQGRARSIRRTRRAVAAGAVAAAVTAVVIPTTVLTGNLNRSDRVPPATNPTETVPASPLGLPFLQGRTLTLTDGTEVALPEDYQGGAVLEGTVFGLRSDGSGFLVLDQLDQGGEVADSVTLDSGLARNVDGTALAYVTDGELVVRWDDGQTSLGEVGRLHPVRLVGGPGCEESGPPCEVYLNDELGGDRVVTSDGDNRPVEGDPVSVTDVSSDGRLSLITGVSELPEPGACSAVRDPEADREVHASCDYTFGIFSADGGLLSATHAYQDGFGDGWHAILDAETGEELARYESSSGGITSSVWEDSRHLLVTSYEDGRWRLTRLGADGSTETVLGPTRGAEDEPPFVVLGDPF